MFVGSVYELLLLDIILSKDEKEGELKNVTWHCCCGALYPGIVLVVEALRCKCG